MLCRALCRRFAAPLRVNNTRRILSTFTDAQVHVKSLREEPSDRDKLALYALFKQATAGPNTSPKPGMFDFVGAAKWSAWKELGAMPAAEAEASYVALARRLGGGNAAFTAAAPPAVTPAAGPPLALPAGAGAVYRAPLDSARGVEVVVLNAPPVNALGSAVLGELASALRAAAGDPSVRALVLASSSAPSVFSGGLDIAEMAGAGEVEFARFWGAVQEVFLALYPLQKPVAAAVEGAAPAGGCWLALQCDHRVLLDEPRATIGLNEVRGYRPPPRARALD
jgi:acyl-CoA-binding protein